MIPCAREARPKPRVKGSRDTRGAAKTPKKFAFIALDGTGKTTARDRRVIRSHCMHGKNVKRVDVPDCDRHRDSSEDTESTHLGPGPSTVAPSEVSLFPFADEVDFASRILIFNFFAKTRETLGPAESCVEFGPHPQLWFPFMAQHPGFTHPVLFCISAADSLLGQKPLGKKGQHHLGRTLAFMNQRLADSATALDDVSIVVVIVLIDFSAYLRDYQAAATHLKGLGEMVRLRGGIDAFRHRTRLFSKLVRLDLIQSLYSGNQPVFPVSDKQPPPGTDDNLSFWATYEIPHLPPSVQHLNLSSEVLLAAFTDLKQLVDAVNTETANGRHMHGAAFQDRVCSIQYRLLGLQGVLDVDDDSVAECLRLAMLAFLATTIHAPLTVARYPWLAQRYREACAAAASLEAGHVHARDLQVGEGNLQLWYLMVGALLSVFHIGDDWFRKRWRAEVPSEMTWEEARLQLGDVLWIEAIHDWPGERVFRIMNGDWNGGNCENAVIRKAEVWAGGWAGMTYQLQ